MSKEELYNQGMEFFVQDKLDEAIAAYLGALQEDADYADALHALAMTYAQLGKLDEAIAAGKRLIEVSPDDELVEVTPQSVRLRKKILKQSDRPRRRHEEDA